MELEPGANLDETSLSAQYGISRTPLREVFRRLAGEGYIQIIPKRGTFVSPMSHKSMQDFFSTAPMIYAAMGRFAARKFQRGQIEELRRTQAKFRKALKDEAVEGLIFWNVRFHFVIGEMADNRYLMPSLERLLIDQARIGQTFWRARDEDMRERINTAADQHDQLIEAIAAGDEESTVSLTLRHWDLSREHMDKYVHPSPSPIGSAY